MRSVTPLKCGSILPPSPFFDAIEIAPRVVTTSIQTALPNWGPQPVQPLSPDSICINVINHPQTLLSASWERRKAVLANLMTLKNSPGRNSPLANSPDTLRKQGLASAALGAYIKAGLQAGKFAPKLCELLDLGLDPFFQWQEQGVFTNLLDAVIHYAASDCALLLAQRGVGHGYLSHPFPGFEGNPRFLPAPPIQFGNHDRLAVPTLEALKNPRQFSGRSIAHTLIEAGSLNEIVMAANSGLNFAHSASNMPHPLVFAVLKLHSGTVDYLISNEDSLGTVAALSRHRASWQVLQQAETAGNSLAKSLCEKVRADYKRLMQARATQLNLPKGLVCGLIES